MFTSCKECVFAKYEGKTQISCQFDRIKIFRETGVNVVEAYDEEKEFYILQDTICNLTRGKAWADATISNGKVLIEEARKEVLPSYQFILVDNGDVDISFLQIQLKTCLQQQTLPKAIHVLRYHNSKISLFDMGRALNETKILWSIVDIPKEEDEIFAKVEDYYIDQILNKYFYLYYVQVDIKHYISKFISDDINIESNYNLTKFAVLQYDNWKVVNANIFKLCKAGVFDCKLMDVLQEEYKELVVKK